MRSSQLQTLLKNIQEMMKCPSCGAHYNAEQIHFLGQLELTCLVQLDCVECNLPVLAHFVVSDLEAGDTRVISDLTETDVRRLSRLDPLSADELLEAKSHLDHVRSVDELFGSNKK